jgi:hypothetical protein
MSAGQLGDLLPNQWRAAPTAADLTTPWLRQARRRHRTATPLPDLVHSLKPCSAGYRAGTRLRPGHTCFSGRAHSETQQEPGFRQLLYSDEHGDHRRPGIFWNLVRIRDRIARAGQFLY